MNFKGWKLIVLSTIVVIISNIIGLNFSKPIDFIEAIAIAIMLGGLWEIIQKNKNSNE